MLLGKDGSEGLDLSFVTNVIFIEQIWDKSLEEQVVARAWRIGATGAVEVETLIAENSVEVTMSDIEAQLSRGATTSSQSNPLRAHNAEKTGHYQRAKLQFLLQNLKLISTSDNSPLVMGTAKHATVATEKKRQADPSCTSELLIQNNRRRKVQFAL